MAMTVGDALKIADRAQGALPGWAAMGPNARRALQEAANSYNNDGRKEGIRQFIDEKSYKPGIGTYDVARRAHER
jgi:hypothetical protein